MLDVHVIECAAKPEWFAQCIASIKCAIDQATFLVVLHVVQGDVGHIGSGRARGYAMGEQPYVTCADDDDYVLPNAFQAMHDALRSKPEAIFTPEMTLQNGHLRQGSPRHHLAAYRRDKLIDHSRWPSCGDLAQINSIKSNAIDLPEPNYVHRLYVDSKARVLRRTRHEELELARA
jgi:hypothetical protein